MTTTNEQLPNPATVVALHEVAMLYRDDPASFEAIFGQVVTGATDPRSLAETAAPHFERLAADRAATAAADRQAEEAREVEAADRQAALTAQEQADAIAAPPAASATAAEGQGV